MSQLKKKIPIMKEEIKKRKHFTVNKNENTNTAKFPGYSQSNT